MLRPVGTSARSPGCERDVDGRGHVGARVTRVRVRRKRRRQGRSGGSGPRASARTSSCGRRPPYSGTGDRPAWQAFGHDRAGATYRETLQAPCVVVAARGRLRGRRLVGVLRGDSRSWRPGHRDGGRGRRGRLRAGRYGASRRRRRRRSVSARGVGPSAAGVRRRGRGRSRARTCGGCSGSTPTRGRSSSIAPTSSGGQGRGRRRARPDAVLADLDAASRRPWPSASGSARARLTADNVTTGCVRSRSRSRGAFVANV